MDKAVRTYCQLNQAERWMNGERSEKKLLFIGLKVTGWIIRIKKYIAGAMIISEVLSINEKMTN